MMTTMKTGDCNFVWEDIPNEMLLTELVTVRSETQDSANGSDILEILQLPYYSEYKTPSNLRHIQFLNEGFMKKLERCIYFSEFI
jgi:hypothetical protein